MPKPIPPAAPLTSVMDRNGAATNVKGDSVETTTATTRNTTDGGDGVNAGDCDCPDCPDCHFGIFNITLQTS